MRNVLLLFPGVVSAEHKVVLRARTTCALSPALRRWTCACRGLNRAKACLWRAVWMPSLAESLLKRTQGTKRRTTPPGAPLVPLRARGISTKDPPAQVRRVFCAVFFGEHPRKVIPESCHRKVVTGELSQKSFPEKPVRRAFPECSGAIGVLCSVLVQGLRPFCCQWG